MKVLTSFLLSLGIYHPLRRTLLAFRNRGRSAEQIFSDIYHGNRWRGVESRSGQGSSLAQTEVIALALPGLLRILQVHHFLDVPCGDFHWMSRVDLKGVSYTGADIVADLITSNEKKFAAPGRKFEVVDLSKGPLPKADLVFCRDCMVHLPYSILAEVIHQIRGSGASWLMATTFPATVANRDIALGDFRPINLELAPFNFPKPTELLLEHCTESAGAHSDKAMGVWRISDLPPFGRERSVFR